MFVGLLFLLDLFYFCWVGCVCWAVGSVVFVGSFYFRWAVGLLGLLCLLGLLFLLDLFYFRWAVGLARKMPSAVRV